MFTTRNIAAAAAAIAFTAIGIQGANAAPRDYGVSGRNANVAIVNIRIRSQAGKIGRARRRGRLNWAQARRVRFELSHIRGFRARYMQDGWLSVRENDHLHRLLDRNNRRIRRMVRYNRGGNWRRWRQVRDDRFRDDRFRNTRINLNRYDGFRR